MKNSLWRYMIVGLLGLALTGCNNLTTGTLDEEKDPYYAQGRKLLTSLDYQGAAEAFEKALEVNPKNALAHQQLCFLYEQHLADYATAIYHGKKYLKLRPQSEFAELVRQHVKACTQELAKTVPVGPVTPSLQRDFERLNNENAKLKLQVEQLTKALAQATNQAVPAVSQTTTGAVPKTTITPGPKKPAVVAEASIKPAPGAKFKSYTVKSGDTVARIARRYNLRMEAVVNANPGLDPKRIKVGQTIKIPETR